MAEKFMENFPDEEIPELHIGVNNRCIQILPWRVPRWMSFDDFDDLEERIARLERIVAHLCPDKSDDV